MLNVKSDQIFKSLFSLNDATNANEKAVEKINPNLAPTTELTL
jgi:hypothetical protein